MQKTCEKNHITNSPHSQWNQADMRPDIYCSEANLGPKLWYPLRKDMWTEANANFRAVALTLPIAHCRASSCSWMVNPRPGVRRSCSCMDTKWLWERPHPSDASLALWVSSFSLVCLHWIMLCVYTINTQSVFFSQWSHSPPEKCNDRMFSVQCTVRRTLCYYQKIRSPSSSWLSSSRPFCCGSFAAFDKEICPT